MPDVEYEAELLFRELRLDSLSTGDLKQTGQLFVCAVQMHGALVAVRVCRLAFQASAIYQFINDVLSSSSSQELKLVIFSACNLKILITHPQVLCFGFTSSTT
jgi:hypothetical protein